MAKIPFDIKYRPQIESGEYKIIYLSYTTKEEYPARIICWDRNNEHPIVALVSNSGGYERVQMFQEEGIDNNNPHLGTLFIVTPEPEMSEFEKVVKDRLWRTLEYSETFRKDEDKWIKELASELLALAKEECKNQIESDYREIIHGAYKKGRADVLKDLPKWKKCQENDPSACVYNCAKREDSLLYYNGHTIRLIDLEKLPGFKDDESHE